jgi:hypothetical protein
MRSDRLARTLLRLYPRAWRARYGEEFLAFVADAGLSWRAVADVVAAAGAERVRALAALLREEIDGTTPPVIVGSRPFREALAETCLFMALVALTVVALGTAGVPWPIRWWFLILFQGPDRYSPPAGASWSERALVSFVWFAVATSLTGLAWVMGGVLTRLGVPAPSVPQFFWALAVFVGAGLLRAAYCGIRIMVYGSRWAGMHGREILGWKIGVFLAAVLSALIDPAGEAFWSWVLICGISLKTPFDVTRAGAARRMAEHEEMERRSFGPNGHQPPPEDDRSASRLARW